MSRGLQLDSIENKKTLKKPIRFLGSILLIFIICAIAFLSIMNFFVNDALARQMRECVKQKQALLFQKIDSDFEILHAFTANISNLDKENIHHLLQAWEAMNDANRFSGFAMITPQGEIDVLAEDHNATTTYFNFMTQMMCSPEQKKMPKPKQIVYIPFLMSK